MDIQNDYISEAVAMRMTGLTSRTIRANVKPARVRPILYAIEDIEHLRSVYRPSGKAGWLRKRKNVVKDFVLDFGQNGGDGNKTCSNS